MGLFSKDKAQNPVHELNDDLTDSGNIDFGNTSDYKMTAEKTDPLASRPLGSGIAIDKPKATKRANLSYGIEEAIVLMRDLPTEPIELVVKVVKTTLESIDVQVSDIIQDAKAKEKTIENRISQLSSEIHNYEEKIKNLRDSISLLEKDQTETKRVKEHLMLAKDSTQSTKSTLTNNTNKNDPNTKPSGVSASTQNQNISKEGKPQNVASGSQVSNSPSLPGNNQTTVHKAR